MAMYLNKNSPHKAEALDFLRFLTSVPGNQLFTDNSGWLPSINGVRVPDDIKEFRVYQEGYPLGQAPFDMIGSEVSLVWNRYFYQLMGEQGNVKKFAASLDQAMPTAIRKDLQNEMRNTLLLVKPQDTVIVASAQLAARTPAGSQSNARLHEIEAGQTMSEGLALQMKLMLDEAETRKK
jgi:hypothetical protein